MKLTSREAKTARLRKRLRVVIVKAKARGVLLGGSKNGI